LKYLQEPSTSPNRSIKRQLSSLRGPNAPATTTRGGPENWTMHASLVHTKLATINRSATPRHRHDAFSGNLASTCTLPNPRKVMYARPGSYTRIHSVWPSCSQPDQVLRQHAVACHPFKEKMLLECAGTWETCPCLSYKTAQCCSFTTCQQEASGTMHMRPDPAWTPRYRNQFRYNTPTPTTFRTSISYLPYTTFCHKAILRTWSLAQLRPTYIIQTSLLNTH